MEASAIHAPRVVARRSLAGPLLRLRSDDQLVALFRMGYEDAFDAIDGRYRARLFAYTRRMLGASRSDAEDVLQDVFLNAYRALRQDDRPVTLRAWLYRVAHNRCIDHVRRPQPAASELYDVSRKPVLDPPAETECREDLRRLVSDLRRLPEQQRSALLMREMEDLRYTEIADALGVTVPAVKSLLVRARMSLTEADEARDAACAEIRADLADAFDRGVRMSGRARRHVRECGGCAGYRTALRGVRQGLGALSPGHGAIAAIGKLLGIGGAGSSAAVGSAAVGGGAAGGTAAGASALGGGALAAKVAAIVSAAAVVGTGAAVEMRHHVVTGPTADPGALSPAGLHADRPAAHPGRTKAKRAQRSAARAPLAPPADPTTGGVGVVRPTATATAPLDVFPREIIVTPHPMAPPMTIANPELTGGLLAPEPGTASPTPATASAPAAAAAAPAAGAPAHTASTPSSTTASAPAPQAGSARADEPATRTTTTPAQTATTPAPVAESPSADPAPVREQPSGILGTEPEPAPTPAETAPPPPPSSAVGDEPAAAEPAPPPNIVTP